MRRAAVLVIALTVCMFAQSGRDAYRESYRAWREADPTLERDAATGGAKVADRAGREAVLAAKYGAMRTDYAKESAAGDGKTSDWLENAASPELPALSAYPEQYVTSEEVSVGRNIDTFINDPDKGIQQLRTELGHERAALVALSDAMADGHKAMDAAREASVAVEQARTKALEQNHDWMAGLNQAAQEFDREGVAWADYYRILAESVQSAIPASITTSNAPNPSASAPAPETAENLEPARPGQDAANATAPNGPALRAPTALNPPALNAPPALNPPPALNAPPALNGPVALNAPRTAAPELRPATPSNSIPPLVRYTGAWTFPAIHGLYQGSQPEFIDLLVNEENGHAKGTLFGRFKLPPGSSGDPLLRLDFAGDFTNTRIQKFELTTSNGAKGTIELIPGPAFNLLEINIRTDRQPGKIAQVDAVLAKK